MKKIILFALTVLMIVCCECSTDAEIEERKLLKGFNVVVIDSCEYLKAHNVRGYSGYGYFAHKGSCRFCKERRQNELEELVEQLTTK